MKWIALSAETKDAVRDQNGVPVEWTILKVGSNPICQEGRDGALVLTGNAGEKAVAAKLSALADELSGLRQKAAKSDELQTAEI